MTETLPALRKKLIVALSPDAAFELFTAGLADWWPVESHSLSASEGKRPLGLTLEARRGGRITEIRHDATPAHWAVIAVWEPGKRIAMDWHVGRSPRDATRIDVRFRASATGDCDIELIHAGFEVLGAAGEASAANYDEGWDLALGERFRRACEDLV